MTNVAIIGAGKGGRALLEMFAERRYIPGTDERLKGSDGFSEANAH